MITSPDSSSQARRSPSRTMSALVGTLITNGSGLVKITPCGTRARRRIHGAARRQELRKLGPGEEFDSLKATDSRKLLGRGHHGRSDAMPLQVRMNRDRENVGNALAWQHDDHPGRPPTRAKIPLPRLAAKVSAVSSIAAEGDRLGTRGESAVNDLNHRSRVLRRRDRNHKIRNRDAHQQRA